jgi:rare lipoprotein A
MKRIIILLFTLYFSAICIQEHTAAQPAPIPVPVPVPAPVPAPIPVPMGEYFRQDGVASWYGYEFEGRPTASGEIYNSSQFTAAHPTLPFGTILLVTNRQNNRQVAVKVNDRGPFVAGRIIDLSRAAAEQLDMLITGTAPVSIDKIQANHPLYAQGAYLPTQSFQPPPGYTPPPPTYLPPPGYVAVPPGYVPPPLPPGYVAAPPGYVPLPQAPVVITQPMLPPPQRLLPPPQQLLPPGAQTPVLIPTPPPLPPEPPQAAPSINVTVYPPQSAPSPMDFSGPRARLNPAITPSPNRIYKLQVGSYRIAGNAVDAYVKLKAVGLDPSYERSGDYFRVVLSGIRGTDVTSVTDKLGAAGFREAVIREER